ncbi:MAG TPA: chromate efflux transporter [Bdellovibrionales bacterium]|jgi:chromate transporter|nr:chromate efflux transporter [Bdellovibrionales bacterium]
MKEVFSYFIRLGALGFGGPLALIASMQKDLVEKHRWISEEAFNRAFALIKAMPGPIAFQVACHLGYRRAGFKGATAAALGLLLPSFVLMILLAIFDQAFAASHSWHIAMLGMQAGALGLIAGSLKGLLWSNRKQPLFWILFAASLFPVVIFPAWEPLIIITSGFLAVQLRKQRSVPSASFAIMPFLVGAQDSVILQSSTWFRAWTDLFISCFKAGAFVFGSGLAIVPILENDFVTRLGWLTHDQFMNALAFGQITPGPVTITATFIGFKTLGLVGAITGTVGIFGSAFIHMTTWFPRMIDHLSRKKWIDDFLTGAIAAVIAAIIVSLVRLAMAGDFSVLHYILLVAIAVMALIGRIPAWTLVPAAGFVSLAADYLIQ